MTLLLIWWSLLLQVASGSKSTEEPPAAASGLFRQPAWPKPVHCGSNSAGIVDSTDTDILLDLIIIF